MNILDKHKGAGWSVRRWDRSDHPGIDRIFRQCLPAFPWRSSPSVEVNRLRQTLLAADVFVAEEPLAGLIGFLSLEPLTAYVPHLFVAPDWRLCGVARALLEVARSETGRPLQLDVDALNEPAMRFYRRLGWRIRAPADRRGGVIRRGQVRLLGPDAAQRAGPGTPGPV
jgi:GNAT superfamily N-acetyltransferase